MVRAEQWAFIHWGMATLYFCLKQRCNLGNSSLLVHLIGPKSRGWMFTWDALKSDRVPASSSSTSKNVGPCVRALNDSPFPASHPFWHWYFEPSAQAKGSSSAKSSAAVPGHHTAAWLQPGAGSNGSYVPFRDAFAVFGCCPARGCHSSFVQGRRAPTTSAASEQGDSPGDGGEG